ncbi:unnamed protein product [Phytophthora fragariaefolia]|uniref:Unnamed protein product n=1 Tax=Phytophthora fragariaefolia TaxID=1490495 RepID=A0A9W6U6V6_9STRA|nr:unnamed protein product [Phytophthora fragariaefolia]
MEFREGEDENLPISFTYDKTMDGPLNVGDGSDEEPFVVGITTTTFLKRLDGDPTTFIHIDATFKLSQVGYPPGAGFGYIEWDLTPPSAVKARSTVTLPQKRTVEYLVVTTQMGSNYARMEYEGQQEEGCLVDVIGGWCHGRYWKKFGSCIHLLHAPIASHRVNAQGNRMLVNRNIVRSQRVEQAETGLAPAGRPKINRSLLAQNKSDSAFCKCRIGSYLCKDTSPQLQGLLFEVDLDFPHA